MITAEEFLRELNGETCPCRKGTSRWIQAIVLDRVRQGYEYEGSTFYYQGLDRETLYYASGTIRGIVPHEKHHELVKRELLEPYPQSRGLFFDVAERLFYMVDPGQLPLLGVLMPPIMTTDLWRTSWRAKARLGELLCSLYTAA